MTLLETLEAMAYVATILGIPIFLLSYLINQAAERKRAEYGTYDALDEKYVAFQTLAVQHAELDIADTPLATPPTALTDTQIATRRTLYQILLATFERAFLMYKDKSDKLRTRQWDGWDKYLRSYCDRPAFVDAFFNGETARLDYSATFDKDFEAYLMKIFTEKKVI